MEIDELLAEAEQYESQMPSEDIEIIQHLTEFGYLLEGAPVLDSTLHEATSEFMTDFKNSGLLTRSELRNLEATYTDDLPSILLRECADIDEGFVFKKMPASGEVSIINRIILYRLNLLGQWDGVVTAPYSETVSFKIASIKKYGKYISELEAINALADIEQFTKRIIQIWGNENSLISFKIDGDTTPKNVSGAFKRRFSKDFKKRQTFVDRVSKYLLEASEDKIDYTFLDGRSNTDINKFIIRVIQVHQWTEGHYQGKLDGDWSTVTMDSIVQSIELYNEDDSEDVRKKEVLAPMGNGYYLFNALFFLKHYMIEDASTQPEGALDALTQEAQSASKEKLELFKKNTQKLMDASLQESGQEKAEVKMGLFKRVYFGIKKFFKKLLRFGKKLFSWIVKKFEKLFSFLKDFFKKILKVAKTAIRALINGIKYIAGKLPLVTISSQDKYLITKFQIDGDGFNVVTNREADLKKHKALVEKRVNEMSFSLSLVGEVISLLKYMLGGIVTWPILIIQLVKSFKKLKVKYQLIEIN